MIPFLSQRLGDGAGCLALAHIHPDADALGSLCAMQIMFPAMIVMLHDSAPPVIARHASHLATFRTADEILPQLKQATTILILDCSEPQRTGLPADVLAQIEDRTIVIDHHTTSVPFGETVRLPDAPSTTAILFDLFRDRVDARAATWLYYGLLGDTLGFRVSTVTPALYRLAAEMLAAGADHASAVERAFLSATLRELCDGAAAMVRWVRPVGNEKAIIALDHSTPPDQGYTVLRTVQHAADIRYVVLLTEREDPDGRRSVRGSVRARPPYTALPLATRFGGGGHLLAAGFTVPGSLAEILPEVERAMHDESPPT